MGRIPQPPSGQPQPKKKQGEHSPASLEHPFDADVGEHHHSVQGGIHRWSGPNHLGLKGNECRITGSAEAVAKRNHGGPEFGTPASWTSKLWTTVVTARYQQKAMVPKSNSHFPCTLPSRAKGKPHTA